MRSEEAGSGALAAVLLAALLHYAWCLAALPSFVGYDVDGHMHYVATLLDEARLPHPMEGWSTFHPPLYHALVALVTLPSAPAWSPLAVGAMSALPVLGMGAAAFFVIRGLGFAPALAVVATGTLLFTPCVQLAATTIGNEALGAFFCALALAAAVRLQRNPRDARVAAATGLALGLALATKSSALLVAPATALPFLRRDLDRRGLRAALALVIVTGLLAAPIYLRNLALTGTPLPMTRELPIVAVNEQQLTIRERRPSDYLWLDPAVFADPIVADPGAPRGLNPAMTNVWGLAYASTWYDAHALRVSQTHRRTAVAAGRALLVLGLVPTALLLLGFGLALRDLASRGVRARDAPLSVAALLGLVGFVAFTARVPTTAAVKGAYLLPFALPAAVFFARGVAAFGPTGRRLALLGASLAALGTAVLFAPGVWLPVRPERREAPSMPPALAAAAAEIDAASAGRWRGIQVEMEPPATVVWRLETLGFSPVASSPTAAWCGYLGRAMQRHLPRQRWRAVFAQEGGPEHSACQGRGGTLGPIDAAGRQG